VTVFMPEGTKASNSLSGVPRNAGSLPARSKVGRARRTGIPRQRLGTRGSICIFDKCPSPVVRIDDKFAGGIREGCLRANQERSVVLFHVQIESVRSGVYDERMRVTNR
jgi:hypothetical protein